MNSLDVYSIRFSQCRTVYPVQIIRPIGKYKVDHQDYFDLFLTDICINNCHILCFIVDNPKRALARMAKSHSAYYPCEYCEARGKLLNEQDPKIRAKIAELLRQKKEIHEQMVLLDQDSAQAIALKKSIKNIQEAIKSISKKNNSIVWPASTRNGRKRTNENVTEIVNKIEDDDILSLEEAKGIMGRSLFLDIPYFNIVLDFPTDYLHCLCLGTIKKTVEMTFSVGENRPRNTSRKLSSPSLFNKQMASIQVPRESSRRARSLVFSVMKGQEFRNIAILFFPIVVNCIEPNAKERRLWLLLAYKIRLCVIPESEYILSNDNVLEYCTNHFYTLYERLFSSRNCTYNTHIGGSHMKEMRSHGPLTVTSAFGFEAFYGELRHAFTPGTTSPLKQIMEKIMLKRAIAPHCCKTSIYYSAKDTAMECNSNIYTFVDNQYELFKIISVQNNTLECNRVGKYVHSFPETPTLNWEKIGVFKAGGISDEIVIVEKKNVSGKYLRVSDLFITCPNNVLEEK